ncbi:MAG: hypothetical protein JW910_21120 [Anaerolineae bacterium]|nr:hypothetical protein [Anaerolineae bacterium]
MAEFSVEPPQQLAEAVRNVMGALKAVPLPVDEWQCIIQVEIEEQPFTLYYQWLIKNDQWKIIEGRPHTPNYLIRGTSVKLFTGKTKGFFDSSTVSLLHPDGSASVNLNAQMKWQKLLIAVRNFLKEKRPDLLEAEMRRAEQGLQLDEECWYCQEQANTYEFHAFQKTANVRKSADPLVKRIIEYDVKVVQIPICLSCHKTRFRRRKNLNEHPEVQALLQEGWQPQK